ncbi:hypothetical protein VTI28DRAFT_4910 [Corynascus sepedonium]
MLAGEFAKNKAWPRGLAQAPGGSLLQRNILDARASIHSCKRHYWLLLSGVEPVHPNSAISLAGVALVCCSPEEAVGGTCVSEPPLASHLLFFPGISRPHRRQRLRGLQSSFFPSLLPLPSLGTSLGVDFTLLVDLRPVILSMQFPVSRARSGLSIP